MPSNNSKYSEEMRVSTAKHIIENKLSASAVAEEMGIDKNTVYSWVRAYRRAHNMPSYPGCPYDNSCVESFFATFKKERIYRRNYDTIDDVRSDLFQYIELFNNRRRRHSVLGYLSPVMYRQLYAAGKVA